MLDNFDATLAGTRPILRMLSRGQLQQLHEAALHILERTGVQVHLPQAVSLLDGAGAWVENGNRVRIPGFLVEDALRSVPGRVSIYDRQGDPAMQLEGLNSYYGPGPTIQYVYDVFTGKRRPTDKADIERAALLCDYLPHMDFAMTMGMTGGINPATQGLIPQMTDRYDFAAMLSHTTKPLIFSCWSRQGLADIFEMAAAVAGGPQLLQRKPFITVFTQPISPLVNDADPLELLLFCAENRIPLIYGSAPLMGGTAPNTIAGSVVQSTAEFLSGLVISQLKNRGAPVICGVGYGPMDMRQGTSPYNGPEYYLSKLIGRELTRFYGLPDWNYGGVTDAKCLDVQAATEASLSLMHATQMGSNLIHDVGYMEMGMTASWELLVLANELIASFKQYLNPIRIDEDTLALDLIDEIGPGGNFLAAGHTLAHINDLWHPNILDRTNFDKWSDAGSQPLQQKLTEKVKWILEHHTPLPLASEVHAEIEAIIARAEGQYR